MKTKYLLYCTKAKPYLKKMFDTYITSKTNFLEDETFNGKILAECEIECNKIGTLLDGASYATYFTLHISENELMKKSCLSYRQLHNRLKGNNGYALCIKNLKVFDVPLNVNHFKVRCREQDKQTKELFGKNAIAFKWLEKAPQNMCKVYRLDDSGEYYDEYILIPVSSTEFENYLNGNATIIIRKRVIKE